VRKEIELDEDGEEITILIPETDEDLKKINVMAERGEIDVSESFGDA
jgi:hypothetical protein